MTLDHSLERPPPVTDNIGVDEVTLHRTDAALPPIERASQTQIRDVTQRLFEWGRSGAEFNARVVADLGGGEYLLRLAGGTVSARSAVPLQPGQVLRLLIVRQGDQLILRLLSSSEMSVPSASLRVQTAGQWLNGIGLPAQPPWQTALSVNKQVEHAAALRYDPKQENAPRVLAVGRDVIARRILEVARDAHVPIVQDGDLAEMLVALDVSEEIPVHLYRAVAEVLAFLYRVNRDAASRLQSSSR